MVNNCTFVVAPICPIPYHPLQKQFFPYLVRSIVVGSIKSMDSHYYCSFSIGNLLSWRRAPIGMRNTRKIYQRIFFCLQIFSRIYFREILRTWLKIPAQDSSPCEYPSENFKWKVFLRYLVCSIKIAVSDPPSGARPLND